MDIEAFSRVGCDGVQLGVPWTSMSFQSENDREVRNSEKFTIAESDNDFGSRSLSLTDDHRPG